MTCVCAVEKVNKPRRLGGANKVVDARAESMAARIESWLQRYARHLAREEIDRLQRRPDAIRAFGKGGGYELVKAAEAEEGFKRQLRRILETHGLRHIRSAAERATGVKDLIIQPSALTDYVRDKDLKVVGIVEQSREEVRRSINSLVTQAFREQPRPSIKELARRIRLQFHGIGAGSISPRNVGFEVGQSGVLPSGRVLGTRLFRPTLVQDPQRRGALYAFSAERASLIARTEMRQAENTGSYEGFKAIGIRWKQWLAFRDGRSGDRHHERMHKQVRRMDELFKLPSGILVRYPADPRAPIKEIANCRCVVSSFRRGAVASGAAR